MLQLLYFTEPNSIRFFLFFVFSVATFARYWHNGDYIVRQIFAIRVLRSEQWETTMMVRRKKEKASKVRSVSCEQHRVRANL